MANAFEQLQQDVCGLALAPRHDPDKTVWKVFADIVRSVAPSSLDVSFLTSCIKQRNVPATISECSRIGSLALHATSGEMFFAYATIGSFMAKYPFSGDFGIDPMVKTMDRFERAETLCLLANKRILFHDRFGFARNKRRAYVPSILHAAREKILAWLSSSYNMDEIIRESGHGPGASVGVGGQKTSLYYKYVADRYTVTPGAVNFACLAINSSPIWLRAVNGLGPFDYGPVKPVSPSWERWEFTPYNNVTFVPKTVDTLRSIAVEPLLNIYLQKGLGKVLRKRLKRVGLDLRSSWKRNQELAREGSISDLLATIDLSMASDTLCYELVRLLLPPEWFELLCAFRSPNGRLGGKDVKWNKFSSMGNGYTFELETMIFYALAQATLEFRGDTERRLTVFGDDIVMSSASASTLIDVLSYCGFVTNADKTFITGPFRESCGKDYFEGEQVRPFSLKRELKTDRDLIYLVNSLRAKARNSNCVGLHDVCRRVEYLLHPSTRKHLVGPVTDSLDTHLHCEWDVAQRSKLVVFDRSLRQMKHPVLVDTAIPFTGKSSYRYVQFMTGRDEDEGEPFQANWSKLLYSSDRGTVVRRDAVTTRLGERMADVWPSVTYH